MKWIEAVIETRTEEIDSLCTLLEEWGVEGICIEDESDFHEFLEENRQYWDYVDKTLEEKYRDRSRIKFYLADDKDAQEKIKRIKKDTKKKIETKTIDDADWENSWQKYYEPIEIGKNLLILPEWQDAEQTSRTILRLEPGLAFGTGSHATTRMCLEVLDRLDMTGKKVLDLGCGSGILGIGALVLGASHVTGCDVDPMAPDAARANAALNHIDESRYRVYAGNILTDTALQEKLGNGYDVVLANIVADVILSLAAFVRKFLSKKGVFICSGIIDERVAEVERALKKNGFTVIEHLNEEEWHCFVLG